VITIPLFELFLIILLHHIFNVMEKLHDDNVIVMSVNKETNDCRQFLQISIKQWLYLKKGIPRRRHKGSIIT
jgi:hypothetical protein